MGDEISDDLIAHEDATGRLLNVLNDGGAQGRSLVDQYLDRSASTFTIDDAELVYARENGFPDWRAFRRHVHRLSAGEPEGALARAVDGIFGGDIGDVADALRDRPSIVDEVGDDGHPLLSTAVGNREAEIVDLLLRAGADVHRPLPCGCTPIHRAAYGHPPEQNPGPQKDHARILDVLLSAGARLDASSHGDGGTPLVMALFWGHRVLAEALASRAIVPRNLRVAAALGREAEIERFFDGDRLLPMSGVGRAFYRPHEGFPDWEPSDDPQEILDEAFVYAAQNGHFDAMDLLLRRGASIDGRPYCNTALHAVASRGPFDVVRWLVERGADLHVRGSLPRGSTALHLAAAMGRLETVRYLVEHGADASLLDEEFDATPVGYAEWGGSEDVQDYLAG